MQPHSIVSREEWIAARKAHLAHEKEYTKARERLAEERRAMPWVKVDKKRPESACFIAMRPGTSFTPIRVSRAAST
jgi:hypothetical protein